MNYENLYENKEKILNYDKLNDSDNFYCNCNCCSCFCPHCGCSCNCKCHQESRRIEKENNLSYDNVESFINNYEQYNVNHIIEKYSGENLYTDLDTSIENKKIKNNKSSEMLLNKKNNNKPLRKNPSVQKSNPKDLNKKINNNKFNKDYNEIKKAKSEFYSLLSSMKDNNDKEELNKKNQNNKFQNVVYKEKKNNNYNTNNVRTAYSYNGNRLKNNLNQINSNNRLKTQSNNQNYTEPNEVFNPYMNYKNNANVKEPLSSDNKTPNKVYNGNNIFYKNIPKNPRNNINVINKNNAQIQNFSFIISNSLSNVNNKYFIKEYKNQNEKLKNEILKKNNQINNLNDELFNLKNDSVNLINENNNLKILFNKYEKMNLNNKTENISLKNEIEYYKNQLSNLSKENIELNKNLEIIQNKYINLENENKKLSNEKVNIESEKLNEEINLCKKKLEKINNSDNKFLLEEKLNKINELEEENKKLMNQLFEYKKNISTLIDDNKNLSDEKINNEKYISELIEKNNDYNNQIINNKKELLSLKEENKNLLNEINILENKNKDLEKEKNEKLKIKLNKKSNKLFKDLLIKAEGNLSYNPTLNSNNSNYLNDSFKKRDSLSSSSKKKINTSFSSTKLMNKLKIETDLSVIPKSNKKKYINNIEELGENLVFKILSERTILCYDFSNKNFCLFDYADYNNFSINYSSEENNGNIYLSYNSILYIVTGKNSDCFYCFNPQKKSMEKLCSLNNNHSKGGLISYKNSIICLSGEHNKKCEIYNINKNKWEELPEMNFERSEFGTCLIKDQYLFSIFGFNYPKNEYLNNIEFLDLLNEGSLWNNLNYKSDNLSLYIKGFLALNYSDNKIILIGGFNGELEKNIENFSQIILGNNFENDIYVENVDRKFKDIQKYKSYFFSTGITKYIDDKNRIYNIAFDNNDRIHIFEMQNMGHDVFLFE